MIRALANSEPDPPGAPKRYVNAAGYVRLRWKIGKGEYVERYERDASGSLVRTAAPTARRIDVQRAIGMYESGRSLPAIARELSCNAGALSRLLRRHGIRMRKKAEYGADHYGREFAVMRPRVLERAGGRCEAACTDQCRGVAAHVHHRRIRAQGGTNEMSNLLAVCVSCHKWIHLNPEVSYAAGWLVRRQ